MLANCNECGGLFNKVAGDVCPKCLDQEEEEYQKVRKYLLDNPSALIDEIIEETGVDVDKIRQFLESGRLTETKLILESDITCQMCGRPIVMGTLCRFCQKQVSQGLVDEAKPKQQADAKKASRDGMYTKPYLKE